MMKPTNPCMKVFSNLINYITCAEATLTMTTNNHTHKITKNTPEPGAVLTKCTNQMTPQGYLVL